MCIPNSDELAKKADYICQECFKVFELEKAQRHEIITRHRFKRADDKPPSDLTPAA